MKKNKQLELFPELKYGKPGASYRKRMELEYQIKKVVKNVTKKTI
tara:strand:- start:63 stop:197 length:135 start_codon:yes stop_codon:yes gene_type:complete